MSLPKYKHIVIPDSRIVAVFVVAATAIALVVFHADGEGLWTL